MPVEDSGIWPNIVKIEEERSELGMAKDWNMDKDGKEREILNNQTI